MDTKLEELKAKAKEMLKAANDENRKQETYDAVKAKLTGFLNDVKKLGDGDQTISDLADQVRAQIVSFMETDLDTLKKEAQDRIAASMDEKTLQDTKVFFLGKKGKLTSILRGMKDVSASQRPVIGALANQVRSDVEAAIADKMEELKQKRLEAKIRHETVDITLPAITKSAISIPWTRHSVKS
jgi:phenylalanyl-tRNA synthetase alpha chain